MKEIGAEGGVIDIQGVGHLSIPAGAIEKPTLVKVSQELEAEEVVDLVHKEYGKIEDFASPIIKIEPLGLELKKPATIYLDTDKERLGNNSPLVISWMFSKDKKFWENIGYIDNDMEVSQYKENTPSIITTFGFLSKQIPFDINSNDGFLTYKSKDTTTFNTKASNPDCSKTFTDAIENITYDCEYTSKKGNFLIHYKKGLSSNDLLEIEDRAESSYKYYANYTEKKIDPTYNFMGNKIKLNIITRDTSLYPSSIGASFVDSTLKIRVNKKGGIEHELWHTFQYKKYILTLDTTGIAVIKINTSKYIGLSNNKWKWESSAEYIGARAYKRYQIKHPNADKDMESYYRANLVDSIHYFNLTFPYTTIAGDSSPTEYFGVAFLTYLANLKKSEKEIFKFMLIDLFDNDNFMKYFHEYALEIFLQKIFNLYPPIISSSYESSYDYNIKSILNLSTEHFRLLNSTMEYKNINQKEVLESNNDSNPLIINDILDKNVINFYRVSTDFIPTGFYKDLSIKLETYDLYDGLEVKALVYRNNHFKEFIPKNSICKTADKNGNYNPNCYERTENIFIKKSNSRGTNDFVVNDFRKGDYVILIISNTNIKNRNYKLNCSLLEYSKYKKGNSNEYIK